MRLKTSSDRVLIERCAHYRQKLLIQLVFSLLCHGEIKKKQSTILNDD